MGRNKKVKNRNKQKNNKSRKQKIIEKIQGYVAVIIIFVTVFGFMIISDCSDKLSYWMGLTWRIVVFGLGLALTVLHIVVQKQDYGCLQEF